MKEDSTLKLRACEPGEAVKPVRVLLEKGGKAFGGQVTFPAGFLPPGPGEVWDDRYLVVSGRIGAGDNTWDEVILTVAER